MFEKSIATSEFKFAIYNLGEGMLIYRVKGEEGKWVGWNIQIFVGVGIYTLNELSSDKVNAMNGIDLFRQIKVHRNHVLLSYFI